MKRALLIGQPADVRALRKIVNRYSRSWRVMSQDFAVAKLPFADAVVSIGGPYPDPVIASYAHRFRKPIGIIWTGSDVGLIDTGYDAVARVRARGFQHAALTFNIARQLRSLGMDADVVGLDDTAAQFEAFFERVRGVAPEGKRRAVVSGSAQRAAAFIESANRSMPEWEFHAAISGSQAERLEDIFALISAKRWYRLGDRREDRGFRWAARIFRKRRYRATLGTVSTIRGDRRDEAQQESFAPAGLE